MNKQIARDRKLFCPNMAHVTAVRSPSGLNVNSAVLVPAIGCTKSSLILMSSAGRLYLRLCFARTPERDWSPEPGVDLITYGLEIGRSR